MARIRSSKPEWWKSAKWCRLPRDIRSTYKGIWEVMCDDEGRFLADPRQVKADVWPLDDDITPKKLSAWLASLSIVQITLPEKMGGGKAQAVELYEVDGVLYGYLAGFVEHQKVSHPLPSRIPIPPSLDRKAAGIIPETSGAPPELLRPEEERDVDVEGDVDSELDLESEEEGASGAPPVSPRVVLPREAETFLAQFYEPIGPIDSPSRKRYLNVKGQLYEVLDPLHPGPKLRGGTRAKARSVEHLVDTLKVVMKNPPPDRDLAIVWVLKKLLDPPKGPSESEAHKAAESRARDLEERYQRAAKAAGARWAHEHPAEYEPILKAVEANYRDARGAWVKLGKESELTQRCSKAAGFPPFEEWREQITEAVA